MLGHVVENELRGNLNWHERSKMVLTLREMHEEELGKEITDREYSKIASEKGITVTRRTLPASRYTMDVLVKTMPNQLKLGLGRRRTDQIYKTDQGTPLDLSIGWHGRKGVRAAFSYSAGGNGQTTDILILT